MEIPADPAAVVNAVDVQSPDRKVVRRRMVQSTLFPLKPHEDKVENSEAKRIEVIVDDEEECCGSQGKGRKKVNKKGAKKVEVIVDDDEEEGFCGSQEKHRKVGKKTKQNTTPRKRISKKVAVNGKDSSVIELDNMESPVKGSPQQLKDKQCTPVRNRRAQGKKGSLSAKVPSQPVASDQASQSVPDLWLEAKKTAEENSRLFSGKQVHPFFTAWKAGKKVQDRTEAENNECLDRRMERHDEFRPIHVFENIQVETGTTDWSNWTLCEGNFGNATCDQEMTISSSEGTFGSSSFGTNLNISKPSGLSFRLDDLSIGHQQDAHEDTCEVSTFHSPVVIDEELSPYDLLMNMEKDFEMNKLGVIPGNINEQQKTILLGSIMSYYLNRGNNPENSLWTNKYQPYKALEVCGNGESVKFINEWLRLWHSTDFRVSGRSSGANKCLMREDNDSYDYDSDTENVDEASGLKNVLLVTGPVGSGKSAAIYACAKEQGFQVIEVNASDWRNGALLKQKFGEAVGSHSLKRSQENPVSSPNKLNLDSSAVCTNKAAAFDLNKSVFEVVSLSEEEDSMDGMQCAGDGRVHCDRSEIKTVILFEDVDATLCEDRGFISTIQQLADTGKRPMILTSNSENPMLPDSLAREEVCFIMPSLKELMYHIYLVCAAEKAIVQPCLIERCINFCGGDIRKTLTHLQFWCHRRGFLKDGKMRTVCSPLMFNLEAGHSVLPRLIPWELPSSLSLFIEAEIANTSCKISTEENDSVLEVLAEEVNYTISENNLYLERGETASVEAKKEAILRGNCFQHVDNDIIAVGNMYDFSDSPVVFARRNVRRKLGTVLSDSEDEIPGVFGGLGGGNNNSSVPANDFSPIPCLTMDTCDAFDKLHTGMVEPKLSLETSHLKQIDISPAANSHKYTGQCVDHTEANCADVNCNTKVSVNHSFNLLAGPLPPQVEAKLEANGSIFSLVDPINQNSPSISNRRNQSADYAIQFMEVNSVKRELGNDYQCEQDIANLSVIPLSDCGESKMAVKRCLFPQPLHVHPIPFTVDTQLNQSTDELVNQGYQETAHCSGNSLISKFLFLGDANLENLKGKHSEIANVNPFSFGAVDKSLNQSSGQMFHSVEDEQLEFQNQYPGTGTTSHINCAPVVDTSFQLCTQFLAIAKLEETQEQPSESADVKHWKTTSHLSLFEENKIESIEHQLPETTGVNVEYCPIVGNSMNPSSEKLLQFGEENQSQYSEATNLNHANNDCQSLDMSCVPESTFVPETEANDEMEFPSGDFTEIISPVNADNVYPSVKHKNSPYIQRCSDINLNVSNDEMGDSQSENEYLEASTSGRQVMDECSRMDFGKRPKSFRRSRPAAKNPVQEKWKELRQSDLKQHFTSEHKHACQILELAYGMSNLISEADLLLHPCRFPSNDVDQKICLGEETVNFGWHDQQVQMASAIAEHGYCLYAKNTDSLQLNMGIDKEVQLAWELLASTNDSMALGKLLRMGSCKTQTFLSEKSLKGAAPTVDISLTRERETGLQNMVQSIAPSKSHFAMRGDALHDYLSSLAHISTSEASRMSEASTKRNGRRVRVAKNYLSSGGLNLSSDDITLLNACGSYGKG